MSYFTEDDNDEDEKDDLIFYDLALLDKILQGMAALVNIAVTHNISSTAENILSKYLQWVIKEINKQEIYGQPDFYKKSELCDRFVMINDFYNFLETKCPTYSRKKYDQIKDAFNRFKAIYVKNE